MKCKELQAKQKNPLLGSPFRRGLRRFCNQGWLQAMVIPGIIWLVLFCYIPMAGIAIAFEDYRPGNGFFDGPWVELKHFKAFLADSFAQEAIWNTLLISGLKLLFCFPAPILFALLLNEVGNLKLKKFVQSVSYLPFFISWVVVMGMLKTLLGIDGPINDLLVALGIQVGRISYLTKPELFRFLAVVSDIWKGVGWGSILYMAAIASIPQDQYEAAYIDGATRFQRVIHVTLPAMMPTITIMLIFNVAGILGSNFDQHLLMGNAQISHVVSTIDTYVYSMGLQTGRYSYATAINLARSVIAFILLFTSDRAAKKLSDGEQGVF